MHIENTRRRSNGTIDIDVYHRLLWREAKNQFFLGLGQVGRLLIRSIAMIATYALLLPRNPLPPGASSIFVSANIPLLPAGPNI
ncbi:MAG: hypothetical protein ACXWJ6_15210 [Xanthobacteraceae bacterium]